MRRLLLGRGKVIARRGFACDEAEGRRERVASVGVWERFRCAMRRM